jgi:hypothetical protein
MPKADTKTARAPKSPGEYIRVSAGNANTPIARAAAFPDTIAETFLVSGLLETNSVIRLNIL